MIGEIACDSREIKHEALNRAIRRIGGVKNDLLMLSDRISGSEKGNAESTKPQALTPPLSLQSLLNDAPEQINEVCAEITQITNEIEAKLF
jgi:hypothetical protein